MEFDSSPFHITDPLYITIHTGQAHLLYRCTKPLPEQMLTQIYATIFKAQNIKMSFLCKGHFYFKVYGFPYKDKMITGSASYILVKIATLLTRHP